MHACRQDLEVLLPLTGLVRPVFDTQIAAALTGLPAQIGYAEAVRRLLGQELAKAHTRTDWSRRPLSAAQIEYALDDVRYLLPLAEQLHEQLGRLGRLEWLAEELAALEDPGALTIEPDNAWLRIKGLRDLDPAPPISGRARPDPAKAALVKKLGAVSQAVAAELNMVPEVLATRRDLEQLADGRRDGAVLRGWRRATVGERLLAAL